MRADAERGRQELLQLLTTDYSRSDGLETKQTPIGTISSLGILYIDKLNETFMRRLMTPKSYQLEQQALKAMESSFLTIPAMETIAGLVRIAYAARIKIPEDFPNSVLEIAGNNLGLYDQIQAPEIEERFLLAHLMATFSTYVVKYQDNGKPVVKEIEPYFSERMRDMDLWIIEYGLNHNEGTFSEKRLWEIEKEFASAIHSESDTEQELMRITGNKDTMVLRVPAIYPTRGLN